MIIRDITSYIEALFPLDTALENDNIGLQVGNNFSLVDTVFIALTLTDRVLDQAIESKAQLIITHHPLIYKSLSCIDVATPAGRRLERIISNNISVYSAHTNLDVGWGGVSDALADVYRVRDRNIIKTTYEDKLVKLVVYVPIDSFEAFRDSFLACDVGHIGQYSHCSFSTRGEGTFLPLDGATPFLGTQGKLSRVQEERLETILYEKNSLKVIAELKTLHPYDEVAYDLIPLANPGRKLGLGRYGLVDSIRLADLSSPIPGIIKGDTDEHKLIAKVGLCGGSGGSLVADAIRLGLSLYISSEFSMHDELLAAEHGLTLLDLGHDPSERPILKKIEQLLLSRFQDLKVMVETV